jgi:hypothetical protein
MNPGDRVEVPFNGKLLRGTLVRVSTQGWCTVDIRPEGTEPHTVFAMNTSVRLLTLAELLAEQADEAR